MIRIFDIALKDLYQLVRDHRTAIFLVAMPIFFTIFMGMMFSGIGEEDPRLPVGFVNEDEGGALSAALFDLLDGSDVIRLVEVADRGEAEQEVTDEDLAGAVVVPAGYSNAILAGEQIGLTLIFDEGSNAGQSAWTEVQSATVSLLSAVQTAHLSVAAYEEVAAFESDAARRAYFDEALEMATEVWKEPPFTIRAEQTGQTEEEEENPGGNYSHMSPGMMIQFGIVELMPVGALIVNERKSRSLQRMLTTATTRATIIAGKMLSGFTLIFAQLVILSVFGWLAFDLPYFSRPAAFLAVAASQAFCFASMGLLIGALSKNDEMAVVLTLVPMFVLSGLGGAWFPLEFASESVNLIGHITTPTAWAMDGFKNILVRGFGLESALLPAGVLLLWGVGLGALAVWRLKFTD